MEDQVTLTAYTDQVRELIHNDRNDEAISICKHVLRYYPKYIDAYRQMGEAHLEKGDLEGAKELFCRVLGADPENVVAYVGLAVIFEQQQAIEEAVWHLERAYELAPENTELHKELLRLYAEVDGKVHVRLKPTAGALARLYAKEGLLPQAIQEYRAIVSNAPARFDARIGLAELLWHSGRMREATDLAQQVLDQLPYCLKANLILGTTWKETSVSDSDTYLNRAQLLDPTNQVAQHILGTRSPLALNKPQLPRYVEGAPEPTAPQVEPRPAEPLAAFEELAPTEPSQAPIETELPQLETPAESALPEKEFGFAPTEPGTEQVETAAEAQLPSLDIEPSVKPDVTDTTLPPWLHATFPTPAKVEPPPEPAPAASLPAWLKQLPSAPVQPAEAVEAESQAAEATLPPWIVEKPTAPQVAGEQAQPEAPQAEAPQTELPSWVAELPPQPTAEQQVAAEQVQPEAPQAALPAWMAEVAAAEEAQPATPQVEAPQTALPPWMAEAAAEETQAEAPQAEVPQAALPSWMAEVAAAEEAQPEAPHAEAPQAALPSWMAEVAAAEEAQPEAPHAEAPQAELPSWIAEQPVVEEERAEKAEEELPPWIAEQQTAAQQAAAQPVVAQQVAGEEPAQEKEEEVLPSWMSSLPPTEEPTAFAEPPLAPQAGEEQLPPWLSEAPPSEEAAPAAPEEIETAAPLPAFLREEEKPEQPVGLVQPVVSETPAEVTSPIVEPAQAAVAEWVQELQAQTLAATERAAAQEELAPIEEPPTQVPAQPSVLQAEVAPEQLPPAPETIQPAYVAPVIPQPEPAAAPARAPKRARQPKGYERLLKARGHRNGNRLHRALEEYDYLVQHAPRLVKHVIEDLEVIVQDPDAPLETHRVLGDAYTHVDRLSEALEQYRFVLEHVS